MVADPFVFLSLNTLSGASSAPVCCVKHHAGSGIPLEWSTWLQATGAAGLEATAILTFTHYDDAVAATMAGQGVVLGRRPLVDELLKRRALVAPFEGSVASARSYGVVVERSAARKPAVISGVESGDVVHCLAVRLVEQTAAVRRFTIRTGRIDRATSGERRICRYRSTTPPAP